MRSYATGPVLYLEKNRSCSKFRNECFVVFVSLSYGTVLCICSFSGGFAVFHSRFAFFGRICSFSIGGCREQRGQQKQKTANPVQKKANPL